MPDMPTTCPLCGGEPTRDGEHGVGTWTLRPLEQQSCCLCGLSGSNWPAVQALKDELQSIREELAHMRDTDAIQGRQALLENNHALQQENQQLRDAMKRSIELADVGLNADAYTALKERIAAASRCDECDPSFTCWTERTRCRKASPHD